MFNSDLKTHLLTEDSFTERNASLIEESDIHTHKPGTAKSNLLESLDVDPINNPYNVDSCRRPHRSLNDSQQFVFTSKSFYVWVLTIILGVGVAVCAYFIQNAITVYYEDLFCYLLCPRYCLTILFTDVN